MPIARRQCHLDRGLGLIVGDLENSVADLRNLDAIVEFDVSNCGHDGAYTSTDSAIPPRTDRTPGAFTGDSQDAIR